MPRENLWMESGTLSDPKVIHRLRGAPGVFAPTAKHVQIIEL
jgi:hypothetical protein